MSQILAVAAARLTIVLLLTCLAGCPQGQTEESCDLSGYTALRVFLVEGASAPPAAIENGSETSGCVIYTDLPTDTKNPDAEADKLRHIGESVYKCLTRRTAIVVSDDPIGAFYHERLWLRIDGDTHALDKTGYTAYGSFDFHCRTINTNLDHIGPPSVCQTGAPQSEWTDDCWTQFYEVLGHEVTHGWLGEFHA